jgi:hypothetical protein
VLSLHGSVETNLPKIILLDQRGEHQGALGSYCWGALALIVQCLLHIKILEKDY